MPSETTFVPDRFQSTVPFYVDHRPRSTILLNSAFYRLERYAVIDRYRLAADMIVGRAFTFLESSLAALGARMSAFEKELRKRLLDISPQGFL